MKRRDHEIFIKAGAYILLVLGFLFLIAGATGSVSVWIIFTYGTLLKKIGVSIGLLIAGTAIFFILLAFHEFLMEFLTMEQEVEELEEKNDKV